MNDLEQLSLKNKELIKLQAEIKSDSLSFKSHISKKFPEIKNANKWIKILEEISLCRGEIISIGYNNEDDFVRYNYFIQITINKKRNNFLIDTSDHFSMKKKVSISQMQEITKIKKNIQSELFNLIVIADFTPLIKIQIINDKIKEVEQDIYALELKIRQDEAKIISTKFNKQFSEKLSEKDIDDILEKGELFLTITPQYNGDEILLQTSEILTSGCSRITYYLQNAQGKKKHSYAELRNKISNAIKHKGIVLSSIEQLQDIFEPNRPSYHSWGKEYISFKNENFKDIFELKNKIINF